MVGEWGMDQCQQDSDAVQQYYQNKVAECYNGAAHRNMDEIRSCVIDVQKDFVEGEFTVPEDYFDGGSASEP